MFQEAIDEWKKRLEETMHPKMKTWSHIFRDPLSDKSHYPYKPRF